MVVFSHPDTTKIIDNEEFTAISTDCVVSDTDDENNVEWISYSLTPTCDRISVTLNGSIASVHYDGLGLFDIIYIKYIINDRIYEMNNLSGNVFPHLPDNVKEIIAVHKDQSSIKTFTLVLNWQSSVSSGSVSYQIDIKSNYTTVKDWVQTEVNKRRTYASSN